MWNIKVFRKDHEHMKNITISINDIDLEEENDSISDEEIKKRLALKVYLQNLTLLEA